MWASVCKRGTHLHAALDFIEALGGALSGAELTVDIVYVAREQAGGVGVGPSNDH